jgi:NAD(P)-dependent dehydrogenase (short-subunit alcohol dehydrogenase family)
MTSADDSPVPDYLDLLRLDGRRFVVIGAGLGIGRQTAHALSGAGARVACVDVEADRAHAVASEVGGVAVVGDATQRADAQRVFDTATEALGGLEGVVDIVGMARFSALTAVDDDEWDWQFDIVLRHAYLAVQLGGRRLAAGSGGVMAFVASASGLTSAPHHAAYGAAKAALMSLVRSAAVELGPAGVRVNAVAPGVVWTPRIAAQRGEPGRARNTANTPLRRVALPADIAAALLFLCSDLAAYVTGQTLVVDGGVGAKFPYPMADEPTHPASTT